MHLPVSNCGRMSPDCLWSNASNVGFRVSALSASRLEFRGFFFPNCAVQEWQGCCVSRLGPGMGGFSVLSVLELLKFVAPGFLVYSGCLNNPQ